jgi:hypothetical protein
LQSPALGLAFDGLCGEHRGFFQHSPVRILAPQPASSVSASCFRMCENRRHFQGLGHNRQVSSDGFSGFSGPNPRFCGASLCPPFSIFRFDMPQGFEEKGPI